MRFNELGDIHKKYEQITNNSLIPNCPVIARLDGRAFHTLTRFAEKPYDLAFINSMEETCKSLIKEFNAHVGYTQSDEITLVWTSLDMFDGGIQKLCSTLSSYASVIFNRATRDYNFNFNSTIIPTFDCRIWNVPDLQTCIENIIWRELDASRNSVNMAAHSLFSNKELKGKSTKERIEMLQQKNFFWNTLDNRLKRGSIFVKKQFLKHLSEEQLEKIPKDKRPDGPIVRTEIQRLDLQKNLTRIFNARDVIFDNREPIYIEEEKNDNV